VADPIPLRLPRAVRALRVIHPLPSAINALVVAALAVAAGAAPPVVGSLALAMFACQSAIGAINDVADAGRDRMGKPSKPIPAGDIGAGAATAVGFVAAVIGLLVSAAFGLPVLLLAVAGLSCGLAYDLRLRQSGLGWLGFAMAFPLLLAWTWLAAAGTLPPGWPLLLPLAAVAGPTVHLANSLVDVEVDIAAGAATLATRLGRRAGLLTLTALSACVWFAAWAVLLWLPSLPGAALAAALGATILGWLGVAASWGAAPSVREAGWLAQAVALGALSVAWVVAASA
jgi:4-hydroxybenzoate polyprenyltransferase